MRILRRPVMPRRDCTQTSCRLRNQPTLPLGPRRDLLFRLLPVPSPPTALSTAVRPCRPLDPIWDNLRLTDIRIYVSTSPALRRPLPPQLEARQHPLQLRAQSTTHGRQAATPSPRHHQHLPLKQLSDSALVKVHITHRARAPQRVLLSELTDPGLGTRLLLYLHLRYSTKRALPRPDSMHF
jgi:hypothetical protein